MHFVPRFLIFVLALMAAPSLAVADHNHVEATNVWARATPPGAKNGAAYMTLTNDTAKADLLLDVASDVAERVEIHTHLMENNVMRMRRVEGGVDVEPGTPVVFQPGGLHVMLMGLKEQLVPGGSFELTLIYRDAGPVKITAKVLPTGADGGKMDHGKVHTH
jgi:copper(I)-binding protein